MLLLSFYCHDFPWQVLVNVSIVTLVLFYLRKLRASGCTDDNCPEKIRTLEASILRFTVIFLVVRALVTLNSFSLNKFMNSVEASVGVAESIANVDSQTTTFGWLIICLVVVLVAFVAYRSFQNSAFQCMEYIGEALHQQRKNLGSKLEDARVTIDVPDRARVQGKIFNFVFFSVLFIAVVVLFPTSERLSFPSHSVEVAGYSVGLEHLLYAVVAFSFGKIVHGCHLEAPFGFSNGVFIATQLTVLYGAGLLVSFAVFSMAAHDVLMVYIYNAFTIVDMQDVRFRSVELAGGNGLTETIANYMVECTFSLLQETTTREEAVGFLRRLVQANIDNFVDSVQVILFGALVFIPVVVGTLVLMSHRRMQY